MKQQDGATPLASDERTSDGRDVTTILDADAAVRCVSPPIEPILGYPGVHGWILGARNAAANSNGAAIPSVASGKDDLAVPDAAAPSGSLALPSAQRLDALERSNRWQAQLLAALSHELRTPLNVIIGYHDLLLDGAFGALPPEQSYTLGRAHRSAREMLDIITATLDLGRMDAGRVRLVTQTITPRDLFDELGREMHEVCDKPGVALEWSIASDVPKVASDPAKLKMIVRQLIRNALQLTDHGTVTVAVRPHAEGLELAVSDAGSGLSRDALIAIIDAQHKPGTSPLERFGGSVLGLHIAQRLVELLGGKMAFETDPATGSTIRVFIPFDAKAQRAAP